MALFKWWQARQHSKIAKERRLQVVWADAANRSFIEHLDRDKAVRDANAEVMSIIRAERNGDNEQRRREIFKS